MFFFCCFQLRAAARFGAFQKEAYVNASEFAWDEFSDPVRRQFEKVTDIGSDVLPDADLDRVMDESLKSCSHTIYK